MKNEYLEFLEKKQKTHQHSGFEVGETELNKFKEEKNDISRS